MRMKRLHLIIYISVLLLTTTISAQVQRGIVKTKGRMISGKLKPGEKLSGAVVAVKGRQAVLSQSDGSFSFPISEKNYMLESVKKNGYQLVDAESAPKMYAVSVSPVIMAAYTVRVIIAGYIDMQRL